MASYKSNALKAISLAAIIALGFMVYNKITASFSYTSKSAHPPLIDEYMTNAKAIRFNTDGVITEKFTVAKVEHTKGQEHTTLSKPTFKMQQKDNSSWSITADSAKSIHTKDGHKFTEVQLNKDVIIEQINSNNKSAWTLETDSLNLYPKTKTAHTKSPVTLTSDNLKITATGLNGSLPEQKMEFLENVQTEYLPSPELKS